MLFLNDNYCILGGILAISNFRLKEQNCQWKKLFHYKNFLLSLKNGLA